MGHKVNPNLFRLKVINDWNAMWFAGQNYAENVIGDIYARQFISKEWAAAGISRIQIKRPAKNAQIIVYAARPGIIIGKNVRNYESDSLGKSFFSKNRGWRWSIFFNNFPA